MKKFCLMIGCFLFFQSCVVSTAAKAVKTVAKVSYGVVKGTVKGVSWAVSKAKGKIDEDKLNGTWKLVGIYHGTFEDYAKANQTNTSFQTNCENEEMVISFKSKKSKFQPLHCIHQEENWVKYKQDFGKNPMTKEKENYITYNSKNYISIIDVNNKTLVLEGTLLNDALNSGHKLYLFEKK